MITENRQWRLMDDGYQDPCGVLLEGSEEEVKFEAELRFQECTGDRAQGLRAPRGCTRHAKAAADHDKRAA